MARPGIIFLNALPLLHWQLLSYLRAGTADSVKAETDMSVPDSFRIHTELHRQALVE